MRVSTIAIPITRSNKSPSIIRVSSRAIFLCLCCSGGCNFIFFPTFYSSFDVSNHLFSSPFVSCQFINILVFGVMFHLWCLFQFHEREDACWWTNLHCFHHLVVPHHLTKFHHPIFSYLFLPFSYNYNFDFGFIKQSLEIVSWGWILASRAPSLL